MVKKKNYRSHQEKLIEVWKVLNALTVSLDRMGHYWRIYGEEAAKEEIHRYMGPEMAQRIACARCLVSGVLEDWDHEMPETLERMDENEEDMGYWNGPIPNKE